MKGRGFNSADLGREGGPAKPGFSPLPLVAKSKSLLSVEALLRRLASQPPEKNKGNDWGEGLDEKKSDEFM